MTNRKWKKNGGTKNDGADEAGRPVSAIKKNLKQFFRDMVIKEKDSGQKRENKYANFSDSDVDLNCKQYHIAKKNDKKNTPRKVGVSVDDVNDNNMKVVGNNGSLPSFGDNNHENCPMTNSTMEALISASPQVALDPGKAPATGTRTLESMFTLLSTPFEMEQPKVNNVSLKSGLNHVSVGDNAKKKSNNKSTNEFNDVSVDGVNDNNMKVVGDNVSMPSFADNIHENCPMTNSTTEALISASPQVALDPGKAPATGTRTLESMFTLLSTPFEMEQSKVNNVSSKSGLNHVLVGDNARKNNNNKSTNEFNNVSLGDVIDNSMEVVGDLHSANAGTSNSQKVLNTSNTSSKCKDSARVATDGSKCVSNNTFPLNFHEAKQVSESENCMTENSPNICLNRVVGAKESSVHSSGSIAEEIDEETLKRLRQKLFPLKLEAKFGIELMPSNKLIMEIWNNPDTCVHESTEQSRLLQRCYSEEMLFPVLKLPKKIDFHRYNGINLLDQVSAGTSSQFLAADIFDRHGRLLFMERLDKIITKTFEALSKKGQGESTVIRDEQEKLFLDIETTSIELYNWLSATPVEKHTVDWTADEAWDYCFGQKDDPDAVGRLANIAMQSALGPTHGFVLLGQLAGNDELFHFSNELSPFKLGDVSDPMRLGDICDLFNKTAVLVRFPSSEDGISHVIPEVSIGAAIHRPRPDDINASLRKMVEYIGQTLRQTSPSPRNTNAHITNLLAPSELPEAKTRGILISGISVENLDKFVARLRNLIQDKVGAFVVGVRNMLAVSALEKLSISELPMDRFLPLKIFSQVGFVVPLLMEAKVTSRAKDVLVSGIPSLCLVEPKHITALSSHTQPAPVGDYIIQAVPYNWTEEDLRLEDSRTVGIIRGFGYDVSFMEWQRGWLRNKFQTALGVSEGTSFAMLFQRVEYQKAKSKPVYEICLCVLVKTGMQEEAVRWRQCLGISDKAGVFCHIKATEMGMELPVAANSNLLMEYFGSFFPSVDRRTYYIVSDVKEDVSLQNLAQAISESKEPSLVIAFGWFLTESGKDERAFWLSVPDQKSLGSDLQFSISKIKKKEQFIHAMNTMVPPGMQARAQFWLDNRTRRSNPASTPVRFKRFQQAIPIKKNVTYASLFTHDLVEGACVPPIGDPPFLNV